MRQAPAAPNFLVCIRAGQRADRVAWVPSLPEMGFVSVDPRATNRDVLAAMQRIIAERVGVDPASVSVHLGDPIQGVAR